MYHIPPLAGIGFTPALAGRLSREFPQVFVAYKGSSGNFDNTIVFNCNSLSLYFPGGSTLLSRTFNNASTTTGQGAKIKTNTGNLILQSGSERIELAANTVQIGNNTIVVSGNRMFTDASNEDLEFDANGTGIENGIAQQLTSAGMPGLSCEIDQLVDFTIAGNDQMGRYLSLFIGQVFSGGQGS